jgi:hypothetical protein
MNITERIEMVLEAIKGSKARAQAARAKGELKDYAIAMEDVIALEATLVGEAEILVDEIKKAA